MFSCEKQLGTIVLHKNQNLQCHLGQIDGIIKQINQINVQYDK
jgi:hypothetical protein